MLWLFLFFGIWIAIAIFFGREWCKVWVKAVLTAFISWGFFLEKWYLTTIIVVFIGFYWIFHVSYFNSYKRQKNLKNAFGCNNKR